MEEEHTNGDPVNIMAMPKTNYTNSSNFVHIKDIGTRENLSSKTQK